METSLLITLNEGKVAPTAVVGWESLTYKERMAGVAVQAEA
jgi:hypothetical protein